MTKLVAFCVALLVLITRIRAEEKSTFEITSNELQEKDSSTAEENNSRVKTKWIEQKLDHFDEKENRTWKMRYMYDDTFFEAGSPVFIEVGGQWKISGFYLETGHLRDIAEEHHGYLFATEHRFYGENRPTTDLSIENLKYLTVKQTLADVAHFIRTMKATVPGMADSKFILFGSTYAGALVTWFKKLYPDLVVGCWATSATLLIKVNFKEYMEEAGETLRTVGGVDCYNRLENAIKKMESMFENKNGAEIKSKLKLCDNFNVTNEIDILNFFIQISMDLSDVVQNHEYNTIQNSCQKIMEGTDDLNGVANSLLEQYEERCENLKNGYVDESDLQSCHIQFCKNGCIDFSYETSRMEYKNTTYSKTMDRQWIYQACNELANFQTLDSRKQPFGSKSTLKFYINLCKDLFGEQFTEDYISMKVQETNDYFGGLEPHVENVYFTHGELDPWRVLGIQDSRATIIPLYCHANDFQSISDSDTTEMRASKERIAQLVREWVGADRSDATIT